jgi:GDSL-like lipase/acylhydrolase family protein
MPADLARQFGRRMRRRIDAFCIVAIVTAWLALVLEEQYQVAWLSDYLLTCDALFLAGVAGLALTRSVEQWGASRIRRAGLRLVFSIAVLAGALFAVELEARFVFRDAISTAGPGEPLRNSLGFREREIESKNPNRYRIAVIGDSFTFGNGIDVSDRFSNVMQGFLGPRYEVLNFGRPGANMERHLRTLDQVLKLSPDFVLLQLFENDFETVNMRRPRAYPLLPLNLDRRMVRSSVIYRLLIDRWTQLQGEVGLTDNYVSYMARHLGDPNLPDAREAFGMLRQFIDRARAAGVPSGTVFFPALDAIGPAGHRYPFGYLHDRVRTICVEQQIPCLDLLPAFSTFRDPPSMWVSAFDAHPNAKANRRAAFEILNAFAPVWQH